MTGQASDVALRLAFRCFVLQREVLRHDRNARRAEQALALWARAHGISLLMAVRSARPLASQLRIHIRRAARARRRRERLLPALTVAPAVSARAFRAKLIVALLFVEDARATALLRSLARDLRRTDL